MFAIAADPLIWEQHPIRNRYEREVFRDFFTSALAQGMAFLISDTQTGELIGSTRYYDVNPEASSVAVGFTFLIRERWGGWWNTAVKHLMLTHAFRKVDTVLFHIGAENIRSQRAILKLGATLQGYRQPTGAHPTLEYRIRKAEWNQNSDSMENLPLR